MSRAGKTIAEVFSEGRPIDEALKRATREAVLRHKIAGDPIVVWKDGKIVWLDPDEIPLDEDSQPPDRSPAARPGRK